MEAIINQTQQTEKKKQKVSIREAKELMEYIYKIQEIVFDRSEEMSDGVYLDLSNALLEMSGGEFYMELDELAGKKIRSEYSRIKPEDMRKYVRDNPHKAVLCPRCDTPLMKKSLAAHLRSKKCKDNAYLVKGTGGCIECPDEVNENIIKHYEEGTELADVELNAENYFWANMANMYDAF